MYEVEEGGTDLVNQKLPDVPLVAMEKGIQDPSNDWLRNEL